MYLKRLELQGFKSFANKTTLEFPGAITAIVGPNGAGKSNVVDGLRWILGEREAKNIRAERSENLLYGGTLTKPRAGFAQVAITFDNHSRFFPVDYTEVTIRRRVGRDGSSEYFLNEAPVRLKDIIDFFSKARLGTKGFSIINQGNSDLFIKANPIERRVMLEEVLGLRQYQIKRHEAENKLQATKINLDKAQALTDELLPHLRLVRRQAGRYEKHDQIKQELNELEQQYFGAKLAELAADEAKITPQIALLDGQLKDQQEELQALQQELTKVEKNQPSGDKNFADFKRQQTQLLNRRAALSKELGRLEVELEFLLAKPKENLKEAELLNLIKDIKSFIGELFNINEIGAIKTRLTDLLRRIDDALGGSSRQITSRPKEIEKLKQEFTTELEGLEKNLAELATLESKLASDMREFNLVFKKAFEAAATKQTEINGLENQKNRLNFEKEKLVMRRAELGHQAEQYGRRIADFTPMGSEISADVTQKGDDIERRMLRLRGELAAIGDIDPALIAEAKTMEERHTFLSNQIADLKKASGDLKKLIADLKEKIHNEFKKSLSLINDEFNNYFRLMFNGGKAKLHLEKPQTNADVTQTNAEGNAEAASASSGEPKEPGEPGLEIELSIPRKNIKGLDLLSGGERSLVSIAVLFALISVSPPPFLVLDEVDAALDESNTKRFADLVKNFSEKTQFLIVTHNRATMSAADVLYGVTMDADGMSRLLSIKLEDAEKVIEKP